MSNAPASYPFAANGGPMSRFGGRLTAMYELSINPLGNVYIVDGSGVVQRLPNLPKGPPILLVFAANATLVNSSLLRMPGSQNYTFSAGDTAMVVPLGDLVWRVFNICRADGIPYVPAGNTSLTANQGRLTLTSGTDVTKTDVTAAGNVYFTPSIGNMIPLYDSVTGNWIPVPFSETTLALSGLTSGKNYDVWGRINGGVLALDTTIWTDDTTRATAIAKQNGINVKSGDATRRLLGSFRTTGTTTTEDSKVKRFLSNMDNTDLRDMLVTDPAATGAQSVGTSWRQANANAANQLDYLCCVARSVIATVAGEMVYAPGSGSGTTAASGSSAVGIGIDAVPAATQATLQTPANIAVLNAGAPSFAFYTGTPGVGRHTVKWIEYVQAANGTGGTGVVAPTWIYTNLPGYVSGISGTIAN